MYYSNHVPLRRSIPGRPDREGWLPRCVRTDGRVEVCAKTAPELVEPRTFVQWVLGCSMRVGNTPHNTPWFRRVRCALCSCCFPPAPDEEAGGSGEMQMLLCFVLGAGQGHRLAFRKKTKKHTTQNETPGISRYRPFVLLRCVSQQQRQFTATGCLQSYAPRGLLSFVVGLSSTVRK